MAAPLPPGWETAESRSTGETYYVNTVTNETTYDRPVVQGDAGALASPVPAVPSEGLPAGWVVGYSRSDGAPYYINKHTGATQFEIPNAVAAGGAEDLTAAAPPYTPTAAVAAAPTPQPTDPHLVTEAVQKAVHAQATRSAVFKEILGSRHDGRPLPRGWHRMSLCTESES